MSQQFGLMLRGQFGAEDDMRERFEELMAQARLAEQLGFSSVAKTGHYSVGPLQDLQQFPFLARLTAEVPRLRLLAGIVLVPLYSPLELAEQLGTLDIMSGGRLIFGAGLGYREVEFQAFGTTTRERVRRFVDNVEAVKRLWSEARVTMRGGHFNLVEASCSAKPVQRPHPPIWIGASTDGAIRRAARLGDTWYANPNSTFDQVRHRVAVYRRALDELGKPFPDELPIRREIFVARTREEAFRLSRPSLEQHYQSYQSWGAIKEAGPSGFEDYVRSTYLIGSPDDVAEQMAGLARETGFNHWVLSFQWPGMSPALALETMHMLGEEVFPRVRALA